MLEREDAAESMIVDVNVSLGPWPFREFPIDSPGALDSHLKRAGVTCAWVRSCGAAFLTDPGNDNQKLCRLLAPYPDLTAVPTVNPALPRWERHADLAIAKIINIYPSFHRCAVDSAETDGLAGRLAGNQGTLLITMRMEDNRGMHPCCMIPDVQTDGIAALANRHPKLRIVCLNASVYELERLADQASNIHFDTAYVEMGDTVSNLIGKVDRSRILFGSHTPFLTTGAEVMKVRCSEASDEVKRAILCSNAR